MYKKLKLLRSITNSQSHSKSSVILDASKYIGELKQKVSRINQDMADMAAAQDPNSETHDLPMVRVEALEKGFVIKVFTERSCRGLLVFVLEAFEELGLDVLQARVSCANRFLLEAVADNRRDERIDAQVVKQAVQQAIENWNEVGHDDDDDHDQN